MPSGRGDSGEQGGLDPGRLALCCVLSLLLPLGGPTYQFLGSTGDAATLSRIYGQPDGGPLAHGPALYTLPAGWILAASCLLLALSALPSAPRRLRTLSVPALCLITGITMLGAQAPVPSLLQARLGVGGSFDPEAGRGLYALYACLVMLAGLAAWGRAWARAKRVGQASAPSDPL